MKYKHRSTLIVLSLALLLCISCFPKPVFATSSLTSGTPELVNPVTPDTRGAVRLKDAALVDLIIPETINGVTASAIGDYAFRGCDLLRTVTIPLTVRTIGAGAFANCSNLKVIILEGRTDTSDLYLGEDWAGNAELVFIAPDFKVPSANLEQFMQALVSARMIKTVETSSLDQAKERALSLQHAFDALSPEECTKALYAEYLQALTSLLNLIKSAEEALTVIPATPQESPIAPNSDSSVSDPASNDVSKTPDEQNTDPETAPSTQISQDDPDEDNNQQPPAPAPDGSDDNPAIDPPSENPSSESQTSVESSSSDTQVTEPVPMA